MSKLLKLISIINIILCISNDVKAQLNKVEITNYKHQRVKFLIAKNYIEWVNGTVNIALTAANGRMLQINNIPQSLLTDTVVRTNKINLDYIINDKIYKTKPAQKALFEINCKKMEEGEDIQLTAQGKVYLNKTRYKIKSTISSKLPEKKYITTH